MTPGHALDGGAGNDVIDGGPGRDTIRGGDGDDRLAGDVLQTAVGDSIVPGQIFVPESDQVFGDGGNDVIYGGVGHDTLEGGDGRDRLAGGPDNDILRGDAGADDIDGGEGDDATDYADRMQSVRVTINAVADDGEPGEGDLVRASVEAISGSRYDDILIGDDGRNQLSGGLGEDRLIGRGGAHDTLLGGDGSDSIDARDNGAAPRASVALSPADLPGVDDSIGCLSGKDTVDLDHDDRISDPQRCGSVRRAVPALRASSSGVVRFRVGCARACTNRLRLFAGDELLAHATRKLSRASRTTMRLRLTRDARRRLRQRPSLRATLRIATTSGATSRTRAVHVTLRDAR